MSNPNETMNALIRRVKSPAKPTVPVHTPGANAGAGTGGNPPQVWVSPSELINREIRIRSGVQQ